VDPITLSAVLLAVVTGMSEALGDQLRAGVVSLVRRPLRRKKHLQRGVSPRTGEAELAALQQAPGDQQNAIALAQVLLDRAGGDTGFEKALQKWWEEAQPVREKTGSVANTISGGTQHGPVLQGRDFNGLTFGATAAPPAPPAGDSTAV